MDMSSTMTHYMQLIATNQPWNLIIFMAIPVILAEYIAITELQVLFSRDMTSIWRVTNRYAGIAAGLYFSGIFLYLFTTVVIPLTTTGGWRGPADVIAVGFYLLGVVPLGGMALMEFGVIGKGLATNDRLRLHGLFVAIFLVVAHVAMIFGMLNPNLLA
jgi:hypothetical protein